MRDCVAFVFIIACSKDPTITPDPTGGGGHGTGGSNQGGHGGAGGGAPGGGYESGSRLKARTIVGSDGSRSPAGWYDSQLEVECTWRLASDGKQRCMPGIAPRLDVGAVVAADRLVPPVPDLVSRLEAGARSGDIGADAEIPAGSHTHELGLLVDGREARPASHRGLGELPDGRRIVRVKASHPEQRDRIPPHVLERFGRQHSVDGRHVGAASEGGHRATHDREMLWKTWRSEESSSREP